MSDPKARTITVLNRSTKAYHTSKDWLRPNESQSLPEDEAKKILEYPGMIDAAKFISPESLDQKLREENVELKSKIVELEKEIDKLKKK